MSKSICECNLRDRRWNANTRRCESCGSRYVDDRPAAPEQPTGVASMYGQVPAEESDAEFLDAVAPEQPTPATQAAEAAWFTAKHRDRRAELAADLTTAAKAIESDGCPHCDPDVGFVCEVCFGASAMRDAAAYLRAMDAALSAPHPPTQPREDGGERCPLCQKAQELAQAEWDAGGSPPSLPAVCPHGKH